MFPGGLDGLDELDDLEDLFADGDFGWEERYLQVKKLAAVKISSEEKCVRLEKFLDDSHPSVRYAAIMILRELSGVFVEDRLILALTDSYEWIRIRAIEGLSRKKSQKAVEFFVRYLDNEKDPKVRATLVKHLGSYREQRLIPILVPFLNDPDMRVRANTVEGLGFYPGDQIKAFLSPLANDKNSRVRANVAVALAGVSDSCSEQTLESMLRSENVYERMGAIFSVGELKSDKYLPILFELLNDSSYMIQKNVRDALAKFGIKIQGALLKEIRSSKNLHFITGAVKVLGLIGDRKSLKTLVRLRDGADGEARVASEEAIDLIYLRTS